MAANWVHRMSDIDLQAGTGVCAHCGPVRLKITPGHSPRCRVAWKQGSRGRNHRLGRLSHGFGSQQLQSLWDAQAGCCAVCSAALEDDAQWSVDHNHRTGEVRGLLCRRCNTGLGWFRDDPGLLQRAIAYLTRDPERSV